MKTSTAALAGKVMAAATASGLKALHKTAKLSRPGLRKTILFRVVVVMS
jgi:hypothetical protein